MKKNSIYLFGTRKDSNIACQGGYTLEEFQCLWLSALILNEEFESWEEYEEHVYSIFKRDFIDNTVYYNGKPINYRKHPQVEGKEQAFFHLTSKDTNSNSNDPNDRLPDLRRYERIKWPKEIIENFICLNSCSACSKIKYYKKPWKNTYRLHFLFEECRYMVVIEERKDYYLLVTAFYFHYDHELRKKIKEYEKYK